MDKYPSKRVKQISRSLRLKIQTVVEASTIRVIKFKIIGLIWHVVRVKERDMHTEFQSGRKRLFLDRKVVGWIPDEVIEFFNWPNP
jgi:hypothetical protein